MKLLIMCMTFLMLLCGAAQAEAPDIAFETDFEEVYRQLVDAQWLDAQSEIVTTVLDQPEQSLKHAADSGEHYADSDRGRSAFPICVLRRLGKTRIAAPVHRSMPSGQHAGAHRGTRQRV